MRTLIIKCDCCGKEIEENEVYSLEHYKHVSPSFNRMQGHVKFIDGQMHAMSGRKEKKEFCLPCYNILFEKFFKLVEEVRNG